MPRRKFGVVVFPGSNCDHDAYHALRSDLGQEVNFLWHKQASLEGSDVVILPGGFSYGDYLRCGAIARFSPIMKEIVAFSRKGGIVVGICNGFQILCEAGLLPGALLRNAGLTFVCRTVHLLVESSSSRFTSLCRQGEILSIPIAHGEGNYVADDDAIRRMEDRGQVLFRYCDAEGNVTPEANPNGSLNNIAGVCNARRNVVGLMPHPEHAVERLLGCDDGLKLFRSVQAWVGRDRRSPRREPTVVPGP